jgi:hypothetical protein
MSPPEDGFKVCAEAFPSPRWSGLISEMLVHPERRGIFSAKQYDRAKLSKKHDIN